jgi:hypothetical protein
MLRSVVLPAATTIHTAASIAIIASTAAVTTPSVSALIPLRTPLCMHFLYCYYYFVTDSVYTVCCEWSASGHTAASVHASLSGTTWQACTTDTRQLLASLRHAWAEHSQEQTTTLYTVLTAHYWLLYCRHSSHQSDQQVSANAILIPDLYVI